MTIKELVSDNINKGYKLKDAENLAAEEIILKKIASSDMAEHVTLKGGIVMYNLTKNNRRVTQDIDFDLIRYSIDKESIKAFIEKMNRIDDGFSLSTLGQIEDLSQEDYKGVRVRLAIKDKVNSRLKLKLDIGVHTYTAITQERIVFSFGHDENISVKVNPPEQIFAEKLLSLARLGAISGRYKDLYDFYYLIKEKCISKKKVGEILKLFFDFSKKKPDSLLELQESIEDTLNNEGFLTEASRPSSRWIDVDIAEVKETILNFVNSL